MGQTDPLFGPDVHDPPQTEQVLGQADRGNAPAPVPSPTPPFLIIQKRRLQTKARAVVPKRAGNGTFPQWLLNIGFGTALVLACACLALSGWYLSQYQATTSTAVETLFAHTNGMDAASTNDALHAHITLSRFTLLSCGIMVGLSFGFLGFGLFLLGVRGEMEAEGQYEKASFKFARMAPGVFVILCATVLVAICVTHPISISETKVQAPAPGDTGSGGAGSGGTGSPPDPQR